MTELNKRHNQREFEKIINMPGNNVYMISDKKNSYVYEIIDGCFVGTEKAINTMKKYTPTEFHSKLKVNPCI
jgi:hypothetical protein